MSTQEEILSYLPDDRTPPLNRVWYFKVRRGLSTTPHLPYLPGINYESLYYHSRFHYVHGFSRGETPLESLYLYLLQGPDLMAKSLENEYHKKHPEDFPVVVDRNRLSKEILQIMNRRKTHVEPFGRQYSLLGKVLYITIEKISRFHEDWSPEDIEGTLSYLELTFEMAPKSYLEKCPDRLLDDLLEHLEDQYRHKITFTAPLLSRVLDFFVRFEVGQNDPVKYQRELREVLKSDLSEKQRNYLEKHLIPLE